MSRFTKTLLLFCCLLVGAMIVFLSVQRPKRLAEEFVGHLSNARYQDAARMLHSPCTLEVESDGSLHISYHAVKSTLVSLEKLPFVEGGHATGSASDFFMVAGQGGVNGV